MQSIPYKRLVRLTQKWINVDDAARLIGYGQDAQVIVTTLVGKFRGPTIDRMGPRKTVEQGIEETLADKRDISRHVLDGRPKNH